MDSMWWVVLALFVAWALVATLAIRRALREEADACR